MLVFVQLSSMNTSCAGSNIPCLRIQRRRSRATSARFCSAAYKVFFEADVASIEEPPNRTTAARHSPLPHRRNHLVQRQIRLPGNQTQQKPHMFLQRRCAAATRLCRNASGLLKALGPKHHHTGTDPIAFGRLPPRRACRDVSDHADTQVPGLRCRLDTRPVSALTGAARSAISTADGILIMLILPCTPAGEVQWTVAAFIVVTLGGVGSPLGALVGGLLLGLTAVLTQTFLGAIYTNVIMFVILLLMLLVRPNGLLGTAFRASR